MSEDAIGNDVSEEEHVDAREAELERIAASRASAPVEREAEVEAEEPSSQTDEVEEEGIEFLLKDGSTVKVPKSAKYRAKIDGEETETDIDKITRGYQKGAAADKRLEEAARAKRELEEYERGVAAKLQELRQREAAVQQGPPPRKRGDLKAQAEKLYRAVLDEVDDPVAAIAEALADLAPDEGAIYSRASSRAVEQAMQNLSERERKKAEQAAEKKRNEANDWFNSEYKEIVEDPHLLAAAQRLGAQKMKESPNRDYREMVKEIGDELLEWSGKRLSATTQRSKPTTSAPAPRTAAPQKKQEHKTITRADILAEMKRDRGQAA